LFLPQPARQRLEERTFAAARLWQQLFAAPRRRAWGNVADRSQAIEITVDFLRETIRPLTNANPVENATRRTKTVRRSTIRPGLLCAA
jgi:hypothetical protein